MPTTAKQMELPVLIRKDLLWKPINFAQVFDQVFHLDADSSEGDFVDMKGIYLGEKLSSLSKIFFTF